MIKNAASDDDPKAPLHVGEVMALWTYLAFNQESKMYIQVALNTTTDEELRHALHDCLKINNKHGQRVRELLLSAGVPLPPPSEEKPHSDSTAIPHGVKLTDYEIANGLAVKATTAVVMLASSAAETVRNDIGMMFVEMQSESFISAFLLKNLLRKHGWLKVPPYYVAPGQP
ncbi:DUF3231 family protein [Tumebacillus permanentifrigoris]|uniref:Uncharacterized protein DUF3231 n=1 Tax=Tumebacillus permanentifrigoris TaxID=378543 RepID=A0A316DHF5_9BACL|nr:DUF3231 family protein [Tumebacillus permanentifrigoris]PWK16033.1 uncharacterized protein DUF3231 [Tumebacillus permanentifrigoris]